MSFPRYPEYKDSGVEWLGEVPGHWQVLPIRTVAKLESGHTPSRSRPDYWENCDVPWFTLADVWQIREGADYVFQTKESVSAVGLANSSARLLPAGTVMLSRTASVGFSAIMGVAMATTQDFANWVCGSRVLPKYLLHTFRAMGMEFERLKFGSTHNTIYMPDIAAFRFALPLIEEQSAIVTFVDREVAKIDALVAEQQNLIALLKEKRQALISHAVTKGLDPDVPMKDSGVAWLGEVPAHWMLTKLKYSTSHIIDCPHETPTYCPDGDYLVVRTADVDAGALDLSNAYRLDEVEYLKRTRRAKLVPQDIVYGREGERWGYAATVPDEPVLCLGQRMMQFRARAGIAPRFLMWQLNSDVTYRQGQIDTVGATSPHVNVSTIANYVLTEPPFSEQGEIANHVDGATSEIDDLVSEARSTVELLQERRTALISAAVTGKIDVRHLAAASAIPTPEPA